MANDTTNVEFESLAKQFLAKHPDISHEWHPIKDNWAGGRTDLVVEENTDKEVFISLRETAITVGDRQDQFDYEYFGRDMSERELAEEAFEKFVELLKLHGHLGNR